VRIHSPRPLALRRRVFLGRDAVDAGLLTRAQLRSNSWRRLLRGVYADSVLPVDHGLLARGAGLVIPSSAAITGRSAAWLWGARVAGADDPVDIVTERSFGPVAKLSIRSGRLPSGEVTNIDGVRLTTPLRSAWDTALRHDLAEAVAVVDGLLGTGRIDRARLAAYLDERRGSRGRRTAARVFELADGRARSPYESRLRVELLLAGLTPPVPQYEIRLGRDFATRVHLAWPEARVAVQYDTSWHADREQLDADRRRLNRLLAADWLIHHVSAADLADVQPTADAIRHLLDRRHRQ